MQSYGLFIAQDSDIFLFKYIALSQCSNLLLEKCNSFPQLTKLLQFGVLFVYEPLQIMVG